MSRLYDKNKDGFITRRGNIIILGQSVTNCHISVQEIRSVSRKLSRNQVEVNSKRSI